MHPSRFSKTLHVNYDVFQRIKSGEDTFVLKQYDDFYKRLFKEPIHVIEIASLDTEGKPVCMRRHWKGVSVSTFPNGEQFYSVDVSTPYTTLKDD